MGRKKLLSFLVLVLLISSSITPCLYGQTENQPGTWMLLSVNSKLDDSWSIPLVGILKHQNMLEDYGFAFIRTGMSFDISKRSSIAGGVAFLNSNSYDDLNGNINSSQIWYYAEYTLKIPFGATSVSQRLRIENRKTIDTNNPNINNRFRYRLQYTRPLGNTFYFNSFNELFLQLEDVSFNQNRFYVGFGQYLTPSTRMDIGYFNQNLNKATHHMVRLAVSINLDFTKKDIVLK